MKGGREDEKRKRRKDEMRKGRDDEKRNGRSDEKGKKRESKRREWGSDRRMGVAMRLKATDTIPQLSKQSGKCLCLFFDLNSDSPRWW